jgi:hypothetical protein
MQLQISSTGFIPNTTLSLAEEMSQCRDMTDQQLQIIGQLAGIEDSQLEMIRSTQPAMCVATGDIEHIGNQTTFHTRIFMHPQQPVFGITVPDMPMMDTPMGFNSPCGDGSPSGPTLSPSPGDSPSPPTIPTRSPSSPASDFERHICSWRVPRHGVQPM